MCCSFWLCWLCKANISTWFHCIAWRCKNCLSNHNFGSSRVIVDVFQFIKRKYMCKLTTFYKLKASCNMVAIFILTQAYSLTIHTVWWIRTFHTKRLQSVKTCTAFYGENIMELKFGTLQVIYYMYQCIQLKKTYNAWYHTSIV